MNDNQKWVLILGAIILGGLFYWFQFRPSLIAQDCHQKSTSLADQTVRKLADKANLSEEQFNEALPRVRGSKVYSEDYDRFYDKCLHEQGLK